VGTPRGCGAPPRRSAEGHPDYLRAWRFSSEDWRFPRLSQDCQVMRGAGGGEDWEICSNMVLFDNWSGFGTWKGPEK
jgi:hypothetical protein